ncbi:hypothetical protein D3C80_2044250 [compost metagenome]
MIAFHQVGATPANVHENAQAQRQDQAIEAAGEHQQRRRWLAQHHVQDQGDQDEHHRAQVAYAFIDTLGEHRDERHRGV